MSRHGSMNRVYRLIWSFSQSAWVVVGELARGRGKSKLRKLIMPVLAVSAGTALAGPEGGQVVSGAGVISQQGATTTINQSSQNLSLNWQRFNVGSNETVNFAQPSASAIAVNRILDTNGSQILGHLNANGQVWLINPNGILFGQGAQVNVGGLVASTLDLQDDTLNSSARSFSGNGNGSVINHGNITTANGGYVALLGNYVSNEGSITAANGTVALGAGSAATLTFSDNSLVALQVDASVLNSEANNGGVIHADGGVVVMTAGAKDQLLASVVNNTGVIEAHTVENRGGKIVLLGGEKAGTVNVAGTLDASAPTGGNGGFIETSAAHVQVAGTAKITTAASMGLAGTWLIDPVDFTIAAGGGDITGDALSTSLGSSNVVIQSADGASGSFGDINVNDVVSWSSNKLTLSAYNDININADLNASNSASLALEFGQGAVEANNTSNIITNHAKVNLPAGTTNFTTKQGSDGGVKTYSVITSLGAEGSSTTTDLQGIAADAGGNYVLGADIDAAATVDWDSGQGFVPIDSFSGTFDGLGHTITDLVIRRLFTDSVGLFATSSGSTIRNVGLVNAYIVGNSLVGGLVAFSKYGSVSNSYSSGTVVGGLTVGGLVGKSQYATVTNSSSSATVSGDTNVGGLVGQTYYATISDSHASGNVTAATGGGGGLAGAIAYSPVTASYATGNVSGGSNIGGLIGTQYYDNISNSYASGTVTATGDTVGGLVGYSYGIINNSYAVGNVTGGTRVGGLVGYGYGANISNTYATGSATGDDTVGGLVGYLYFATLNTSYSSGLVTTTGGLQVGGLFGSHAASTVNNSYWNITSSGQADSWGVGTGLTDAQMHDASNLVGFNFTTTPGAGGNNWVMVSDDTLPMLASEYSTTINNAHQLQLMAMDLAGIYTLAQDINATATAGTGDVWSSSGFVPVGNSSTIFNGSFDGQGHTISGLVINRSTDYVGLFGKVNGSVIENVGLVGGSIQGGDHYVGGLVGYNRGTVDNSYTTGNVHGNRYEVGGLVGANYGVVTSSHATGNVSAVQDRVGGLAGVNYDSSISDSYATGTVSGAIYVGGLVGLNDQASIDGSYATGATTASGEYGGGLAGYSDSGSTISNSYSTGNVAASAHVGGLVGENDGVVSNSHYDVETVLINGATATSPTVGGLYSTQYQDWFNNGLTLDIADYSATLASSSHHHYTISTVQGWRDFLGFADVSAYTFTQTADIDLAGQTNSYIPYLAASFDGGGYAIANFTFTPSFDRVGLFGQIADGTTVNNVNLLNVTVSGGRDVGGLAGANHGTISDSRISGSVSGSGYGVGGLVGHNWGTISNSSSAVDVTGSEAGGLVGRNENGVTGSHATGNVSGNNFVGGLVGSNIGTISNSYASTGTVDATGIFIGGLVGQNFFGSIDNSYASSNVSGTGTSVGGLVGYGYGTINNSYATGNVTGTGNVGGLVGLLSYSAVNTSYASGLVSAVDSSSAGGLVGFNANSIVTNSYWDITSSGQASSAAGTGLTTEQMLNPNNFSGFNFTTTPGASGNNWVTPTVGSGLNGGDGATRPMLASEYSTTISNAHQLQLMIMDLSAHYVLAQNIDATATAATNDVWANASFVSIGKRGAGFSGSLDGQGHTINGLQINLPPDGNAPSFTYTDTVDGAGLFGQIDTSGAVSNVGLVGGSVTARDFTGALAGQNDGTITNSYASTTVIGRGYVGGLVGRNMSNSSMSDTHASGDVTGILGAVGGLVGYSEGSLSNSYATGAVQGGENSIGGLVGASYASISNSFATGSVSGSNYVGGLVGKNFNASISNSYATGAAEGNSLVGGLVGINYGAISNTYSTGSAYGAGGSGGLAAANYGSITNSFWNTQTSGLTSSNGGTGLTTNEMMRLSSFNSWNTATPDTIANTGGSGAVWRIYEGLSTPLLTQYLTPLTLTGSTGVTYNGTAQGATTTVPDGVLANTQTNAGTYAAFYSGQLGYDISGGATLTINKANLTIATSDVTKTYDGTLAATGTAIVTSGTLFTNVSNSNTLDSITGGTFAFTDANAGSGNKTVTTTGVTVSDGNGGGNYNVTYANNTTSTINKADLTITTSDVTKTYDGTLAATGTAVLTSGTLYSNASNSNITDSISGGTFAFTNANAGSGNRTVTTTAVTVSDGNSGGNYNVTYANNNTSTINKADLTIATSNVTKTYNSTLAANGTAVVTSGALYNNASNSGITDGISGGTFAFTNANVGNGNKTVTTTGVTVNDGNSGGNYNVTYANNNTSTISQANLTISTSNVSKIYDGGLSAAGNAITTSGTLFGSDSLSGGSFAFTDKNVGSGNKSVTTSGVTISDGNAGGNYNVTYTNNATSTITPAQLAVTGVTANDKTYDGTTAATLSGLATVTAFGSDTVAVSGTGTGSFADAAVGVDKAVTVSGFTLSGADAGNYAILQPADLSADIKEMITTVTPVTPVIPVQPVIPEQPIIPVGTTHAIITGGQIVGIVLFPPITSPIDIYRPSIAIDSNDQVLIPPPGASRPDTLVVGTDSGIGKPLLQVFDGGMKLPNEMADENE